MMKYLIELGIKYAFAVLQLFSEKLLQHKDVGAEYLPDLCSLQKWSNNSYQLKEKTLVIYLFAL